MNPINPLKYALELDAQRYGYQNSEEYVKAIGKESLKSAVTAGLIIASVPTGTTAVGFASRARLFPRLWGVIKNVAFKVWDKAKSAWYSIMHTTALPPAQDAIKKTAECVKGMIDGSPAPDNPASSFCFTVKSIIETEKKQ